MTKPRKRTGFWCQTDGRLFTLDVTIVDGPMTEAFCAANKKVLRRIEMRGDNTLADLHNILFEAFDREDPHLFEFHFDIKKPWERGVEPRRYVMEYTMDVYDKEEMAGQSETTTLGATGIKEKEEFWYWFDFGDDWWHKVKVVSIGEKAPEPEKAYPRIVKRVGESPPQYPDWDEEEDEDES